VIADDERVSHCAAQKPVEIRSKKLGGRTGLAFIGGNVVELCRRLAGVDVVVYGNAGLLYFARELLKRITFEFVRNSIVSRRSGAPDQFVHGRPNRVFCGPSESPGEQTGTDSLGRI